jgi:hypothetical protein
MHNAEATGKVWHLRREDRLGCGLADQPVDGGPVSGAGRPLGHIRQRDPRTGACDIGEPMNSERIASANKQRRAAIFREKACLRLDCPKLTYLSQGIGSGHDDVRVDPTCG